MVCHVQRVYFTSIRAKTHSIIFLGVLWPGYLFASRWNAFDWCWPMMYPSTYCTCKLIVIELDITRLCVAYRYWWHLWLWRIWWWQRYQTRNNRKLWWLYSTLDSHWVGYWLGVYPPLLWWLLLASGKGCIQVSVQGCTLGCIRECILDYKLAPAVSRDPELRREEERR